MVDADEILQVLERDHVLTPVPTRGSRPRMSSSSTAAR